MNTAFSSRVLSLPFFGALLALGACQTGQSGSSLPPPSTTQRVELSNEFAATALVVSVAPAERLLTLRREDGSLLELQAGQAVRNFDQIAVGDELRVRYQETLAASLRPAGEKAMAAEGTLAAARAKPGAKPGAGMGVAISLRVRIESIDLPNDIVVFSLASGELVAHRIATPDGRAFVRGLKLGDTVQLDYSEGLALSIEEL